MAESDRSGDGTGSSASIAPPVSMLAASLGGGGNALGRLRTLPGYFLCRDCGRSLPIQDLSARALTCKPDAASYKALTDRWKSDRKLRMWFVALSPEARTNWHLENQAVSGAKRKFGEIEYTDASILQALNSEYVADEWIPWKWFKIYGTMEGKTLVELEAEWERTLTEHKHQCKWVRGEWCVPVFRGVKGFIGTQQIQESTTARHAINPSVENLQSMVQSGDQLRRQFLQQATGPIMPPAENVPQVADVHEADMPNAQPLQDVMSKTIIREAMCRSSPFRATSVEFLFLSPLVHPRHPRYPRVDPRQHM